MLVECKHCGAPLDVKPKDRLVACRYCDRVNRVRSLRTVAMETPPTWQPPPQWRPPDDAPVASKRSLRYHRNVKQRVAEAGGNRPVSCTGCLVLLFVLLPVGINLAVNPALREVVIGWRDPIGGEQPPQLGQAPLTPPAGSRTWSGTAEGARSASELRGGCSGAIPRAPHLAIQTHAPVFLTATTRGRTDLVMVVRSSDGTVHCDDDSGGDRQPRIATALPAGVHELWVGPFHTGETVPFELELGWQHMDTMPGADGLAAGVSPSLGEYDPAQTPEGSWMGSTTGHVEASRAGSTCDGAVPPVPHLRVHLEQPALVELTTQSTHDLTMLARAADGTVHCDDDSGGARQPALRIPLGPGDHQVWVGTFHAGDTADFTLQARGQLLSAAPGPDGLASDAAPTVEKLVLAPGAPRARVEGTARGLVDGRGVGPTCRGFYAPAPHVLIELAEPTEVDLTARSRSDLTMIARHDDGQTHCDDDSGRGTDPRIRATFAAGRLRVWIGTLREGQEAGFVLSARARGI